MIKLMITCSYNGRRDGYRTGIRMERFVITYGHYPPFTEKEIEKIEKELLTEIGRTAEHQPEGEVYILGIIPIRDEDEEKPVSEYNRLEETE